MDGLPAAVCLWRSTAAKQPSCTNTSYTCWHCCYNAHSQQLHQPAGTSGVAPAICTRSSRCCCYLPTTAAAAVAAPRNQRPLVAATRARTRTANPASAAAWPEGGLPSSASAAAPAADLPVGAFEQGRQQPPRALQRPLSSAHSSPMRVRSACSTFFTRSSAPLCSMLVDTSPVV